MNKFSSLEEYSDYLFDRKEENSKISKACDLLARSDNNIRQIVGDTSLSAQEFIEVIALRRREGYSKSTGGGNDTAGQQIDRMYMNTPWKFVEEFLQNADDCRYDSTPRIQIIVDEMRSSVEFIYNERGFSREDVWALTAFSQSTKSDVLDIAGEGVFYKEKTGRKGFGFKSVFSLAAENVCVHVRSNGFSFRLDNKIGRVVPIWEDDVRSDGMTHVIVELIQPDFPLNGIYPKLRELFCVADAGAFFQRSPALFMHRLQDITVSRVSEHGAPDSFSVVLEYDPDRTKYCEPFQPEGTILAGIRRQGVYYRKQYSHLDIHLSASSGEVSVIPCVRETQMVLVGSQYRNLSILCPIMCSDEERLWSRGSLFRTFPMMDHEFALPFAMDAPYELNSARKGIEYNAVDNARQLNTAINHLLFAQDGLLADFVLYIRDIENIRMDFYMHKGKDILFDNDANRDDTGRRLIPEVDLMRILRKLPVFKLYAGNGFAPLDGIISVDADVFSWLDAEKLFDIVFRDHKVQLASERYAGGKLLGSQGLVTRAFAAQLNEYLDDIELRHDRNSDEYLSFFRVHLYPFLARQKGPLMQHKSYETLQVFLSRYKDTAGEQILRETCFQGKWFHHGGADNLSFADYRIFESAPVDLAPLASVLKDLADIKDLDDAFLPQNIHASANAYTDWNGVKGFIEAALYYGYSLEGLRIRALDHYAVCKECDAAYNPFRDAGIVESISKEDVEALAAFFGSTEAAVAALKQLGVRPGNIFAYEDPKEGPFTKLYPDSIALINSPQEDIVKPFLEKIYNFLIKKEKTLDLTYANIEKSTINIKLELLRKHRMFAAEARVNICEAILGDEQYWEGTSDVKSELIIRARAGAKKNTSASTKPVIISLQHVLEHDLGDVIRKALEGRHFNQIRIRNNNYFKEIPGDEIQPIIRVLAPEKLEPQAQADNMRYFCGDLSSLSASHRYLLDGSGKVAFLHLDEQGDYKASLASCLDTSFDPKALSLIAELEEQNRCVREQRIIPALNLAGHNLKEAFKILEMEFPSITKKEYIQILSWFRFQSYSEEVGNAASSNEKEIERDYRDRPWRFVYEFLQNVDDCSYPADVETPALKIEINEAAGSISFTYNEVGFSQQDIDAITKFGSSNKTGILEAEIPETGIFDREKTGRMGRGFKSVFALPGNGIVVHIQSNGYTFKFVKRLGQIIPVWEDVADAPAQGTRMIVEGFSKKSLNRIYKKLRGMFSIDNTAELFAACPVLYLRKLKQVAVSKGTEMFSVDICLKERTFSEQIVDPGSRRIVSGIRQDGRYCAYVWDTLLIRIRNGAKSSTAIDAVRYTKMLLDDTETRTVSVTAPVLTREPPVDFSKGSLYRTLPLSKNTFGLPLAINAPFKTDDSRSLVQDQKESQALVDTIMADLLPAFYQGIRSVEGIDIQRYIASSQDSVFEGYQALEKIDWGSFTRKQPVLKLYGTDGYVNCRTARVLPRACYAWPLPAQLAAIFSGGRAGTLVEEAYADRRLSLSPIGLIDAGFVDHLNAYLDAVEENEPAQLWSVLQDAIYPLITAQYTVLHKIYAENTADELRKLNIFGFCFSDGTIVREPAASQAVWLSNCPRQFAAHGNYRSLNCSPLDYTPEQLAWISRLHSITEFQDAFSKGALGSSGAREISCWEDASKLIETILYYHAEATLTIPYLRKCVLSEALNPEENIFRDAYLESQNHTIISHFISEDNVIDIWTAAGDASGAGPEEIVSVITQLGVRTGNDFFDYSRDAIRCNSETLQLFREYCVSKEKAERVLGLVSAELACRREHQGDERRFVLDYPSVAGCSPGFFTCLFRNPFLDETDTILFAEKYYNDEARDDVSDPERIESFIHCALLLPTARLKIRRELSLDLSEIISRKIGRQVQKAVLKHGDALAFRMVLDVPVEEYSGEQISKALRWLSDADEPQNAISKTYQYYTAVLDEAFEAGTAQKQKYLCDGGKVILNRSAEKGSLLAFVRAHYQGKDHDFSTLINIITQQEELKSWDQSKQLYVSKLAAFRTMTGKIMSILCPGMIDHTNNANGKTLAYIVPELLQNINDCPFADPAQVRNLRIEVAPDSGIMRLSYEEAGFDFPNVYSITALGQSSKHDQSEGEKGLGFKKVFALFDTVEIYSNGFFFSLTRKEPTVPAWISDVEKQKENEYANGTCMVFRTNNKRELKHLVSVWKKLFEAPYADTIVSPLFLEHIASYSLFIEGDKEYSVTREAILHGYYIQKRPLLDTFERLLPADGLALEKRRHAIRTDLRKRVKCKAMSDEEFENYLNQMSISVCFPRDPSKKINGVFYSTLPTTNPTNLSVLINLPLELTTGRDAILEDSVYNRRILNMVFHRERNGGSVFGSILQQAAVDMPDTEVFEYIRENVTAWVDMISNGDMDKALHREELARLPIFHAYPDHALVSAGESYSLDPVIYQYIQESDDVKTDIEQWLHRHFPASTRLRMLTIRKPFGKTCAALEKYASDLGLPKGHFPLTDETRDLVVDYFRDEYGALEVEEYA